MGDLPSDSSTCTRSLFARTAGRVPLGVISKIWCVHALCERVTKFSKSRSAGEYVGKSGLTCPPDDYQRVPPAVSSADRPPVTRCSVRCRVPVCVCSVQGGLKLGEISLLNLIHVLCEFNYANKSHSAVRPARRSANILSR